MDILKSFKTFSYTVICKKKKKVKELLLDVTNIVINDGILRYVPSTCTFSLGSTVLGMILAPMIEENHKL